MQCDVEASELLTAESVERSNGRLLLFSRHHVVAQEIYESEMGTAAQGQWTGVE